MKKWADSASDVQAARAKLSGQLYTNLERADAELDRRSDILQQSPQWRGSSASRASRSLGAILLLRPVAFVSQPRFAHGHNRRLFQVVLVLYGFHFRPTLDGKRFTDERIGKPANGVGD